MNDNNIINGDCIEELKKLPDNSVDAIITDPPYGLEFMGKDWDKFKEGKNIAGGTTGIGTPFGRSKAMPSFYQMNKKRFGIKGEEGENDLKVKKNFNILPRFFQSDLLGFQEFTTNWASECLRVLKPGGYLLSFGGTRTYHRMACGIEDAGFEIRDTIMWVYGSGFPKSLNIGKQIDKIQGNEREVVGKIREGRNTDGGYGKNYGSNIDDTKGNSEWEGWGTALKPAVEPIVVARKPLSEKNVALNVLKWGTGGINIDECRIPTNEVLSIGSNNHSQASVFQHNQILNSKQNELGRFPANIILECTCDRLEEGKAKGSQGHWSKTKTTGFGEFGNGKSEYFGVGEKDDMKCVVHTNLNCPCYMLDEQSGESKSTPDYRQNELKNNQVYGKGWKRNINLLNDKGGASRFFYCAKASKSERNDFLCDYLSLNKEFVNKNNINIELKNNHPTVKPIALMEYLIKLVSKENAIVLDPFLGSGTTAIACLKLNRNFIGIEKEPEYIKIAEARIKPYLEQRKLLVEEKQNE